MKAESFFWDFGDGTISEEIAPEHTFYLSGNYPVTLIAKKGRRKNKKVEHIYVQAPTTCLVLIETTLGSMMVELSDLTPKHRDNFIKNADEGYYEGTLFHRVIRGFMAQAGDPDSKGADSNRRLGSGGPGYTIEAEINQELIHVKGALAAARQPDNVNPEKRSSGSQFYIVDGRNASINMLNKSELEKGIEYSSSAIEDYLEYGGTPFLDQEYTVFGKLVSGIEVLDAIVDRDTNSADRPLEDIIIKKVRVIR